MYWNISQELSWWSYFMIQDINLDSFKPQEAILSCSSLVICTGIPPYFSNLRRMVSNVSKLYQIYGFEILFVCTNDTKSKFYRVTMAIIVCNFKVSNQEWVTLHRNINISVCGIWNNKQEFAMEWQYVNICSILCMLFC